MIDERIETRPNVGTPPTSYGATSESLAVTPVRGVVSFLSGTERRGRWQLPRHLRVLAVMGSVELDLREAEVGPGVSVIEAVGVLGSVEVIVPPEITVECEGDAFLGNFALQYAGRVSTSAANRDRVVKITGTAYLSAVTVRVKGPDEPILNRLRRTFGRDRR